MKKLLMGIILISGMFSSIAVPGSSNAENSPPQSLKSGRRIFAQSCASCHAAHSAASRSAPGIKDYFNSQHPSDAAVRTVIGQGKGKMPGFPYLTRSQTDDLIAYLKTL
ncbi:MAG TPA: c-type cytochrome [Pseudacidobacterium sp.]|jgi:mono/diheme cytochrome c family protein|nr:c-type cytochrome [Pseudacidobacterium sp.]